MLFLVIWSEINVRFTIIVKPSHMIILIKYYYFLEHWYGYLVPMRFYEKLSVLRLQILVTATSVSVLGCSI